LFSNGQRMVAGDPNYCAMYNGRLYMFSSAVTQSQFNKSPQRFAVEK
jgi:YHS domain-containing protein